MDVSKEFVCKFCNKKFPSGKSLGGHIRIHTNEYSVHSNGNKNKRLLVASKQEQQRRVRCIECGKGFVSLKALSAHMACHHSDGEKEMMMLMDSQSDDTDETSSAPSTRKRSKRVMRQSDSESLSNGSSSFASEIDQEDRDGAFNLMIMSSSGSSFKKGHNLVVMKSLGELSENNSVVLETKSSSGEELKKISNVKKNGADEVAVDDGNGVILCDSDRSDSDYFMNGPNKSDSDISVDGSLKNKNTGFGFRFRNSDEGRSKYELSNRKIHRSRDISKSLMVKRASPEKKKSKGHMCPVCLKMFKSGQALGGHKRSHSFANHQEQHNQVADMLNQIDLNLPASDVDE